MGVEISVFTLIVAVAQSDICERTCARSVRSIATWVALMLRKRYMLVLLPSLPACFSRLRILCSHGRHIADLCAASHSGEGAVSTFIIICAISNTGTSHEVKACTRKRAGCHTKLINKA